MQYTASKTAIGAALLRAAHQLIDGEERLLTDPVTLRLLGDKAVAYILDNSEEFNTTESRHLRTHVVLRSRYTEDRLKVAYDSGVRQFIILGAGLDTFAYRQPEWAADLAIVEADHPASQAYKLEKLQSAGIVVPANVSYLKVDLERNDLKDVFETSAINISKPVFMACLGVLIYLNKNTVDKLFHFASSLPPGSEFVFTTSFKNSRRAASVTAQKAATVGEPWLTYFEPDSLEKELKHLGFDVTILTPDMAFQLYYLGKGLQIPIPKNASVVSARL